MPLSETLQDDPSCQLCVILQKYYAEADLNNIEMSLKEGDLPQLFTLKQVILITSVSLKLLIYVQKIIKQHQS